MNNQWHTLFGFRILLGVFALTWQACRVFQLLHGHSKLASSYTADRCRFKPSANHSCANSSHNATSTPPLPPPYPASAAFLQFCVVLFCFGLFWLLFLVTVSFFQILLLGRRVSNFHRHFLNLSARFARPACRSLSSSARPKDATNLLQFGGVHQTSWIRCVHVDHAL